MTWNDPIIQIIAGIAVFLGIVILLCLVITELPTVKGLFLGLQVPPVVVSSVRNVASVLGSLVVAWILHKISSIQDAQLLVLMIPVTGLINNTWGVVDQWLKKDQNLVNPPPVAGSGTDTPLNPNP